MAEAAVEFWVGGKGGKGRKGRKARDMDYLRTRILIVALMIGASGCGVSEKPKPVAQAAPDLSPAAVKAADEFIWLEDVAGDKAMDWVREQNAKSQALLEAEPHYAAFREEALAILTAQDRTPTPRFHADGISNFWQDGTHVRGVWRHASIASYRGGTPDWQTLLDVDALAKNEGKNWLYKGAECLAPADTRCLISLSEGGEDAVTVREFDAGTRAFVAGGFSIPRGKHGISWLDQDTLLVASDFGPGTLTESGYPFIVKTLKRGQTLAEASELFRGDARDGGYGVDTSVMRDGAGRVLAVIVSRPLDTYRSEYWEVVSGKPVRLKLPEKMSLRGAMPGKPARLVLTIDEPWTLDGAAIAPGTLLAVPIDRLRTGADAASSSATATPVGSGFSRTFTVFAPSARQSVEELAVFDDRLVVSIIDNVKGQALVFTEGQDGWSGAPLPSPDNVAVHLGSASRRSGRAFYSYEGFLTPATLSLADVKHVSADIIRTAPAKFDGTRHVVEQFDAASADGTKIPYFVVRPKDAPLDGSTPTMMFGYGGFQVSYPPAYKPELGRLWLERGGAYVLANIRGGGEFGPAWHQAALKANRQRAFDDFAAVAADLAARKITSAKHLGIYGRSNGGVLTSVMLTQHPELIGAAVIESPLVDMLRYHELPPGASWMGEYGDPRIPEEAAWIAKYSAYQIAKPGRNYPEVYITTNMRDDRVHPGHARKFAARLQAMGYQAIYFENTEGGHSNDSDPVMNASRWARHYAYLARALGLK